MPNDAVTYCNCIEQIKERIALVHAILDQSVTTHNETFDTELIFVQFRKTLELIAFASLSANKTEYSAAYEKFARHWHADRMLKDLAKINPQFYPFPVTLRHFREERRHHADPITDGYLTKDEFVVLYGKCGEVLHAQNPFTAPESRTIQLGYSVRDWVSRMQKLLDTHVPRLANDDFVWLVKMIGPNEGKAHAVIAGAVE